MKPENLLKRVRKHTRLCVGCFPLHIFRNRRTSLNKKALLEALHKPPDRGVTARHLDALSGEFIDYVHPCCGEMLLELRRRRVRSWIARAAIPPRVKDGGIT